MVANVDLEAREKVDRLSTELLSDRFVLPKEVCEEPVTGVGLLREIVVGNTNDLEFKLMAAPQENSRFFLDAML
ncbi:hypothetical protein D3C77_252910 [compost metagenome]